MVNAVAVEDKAALLNIYSKVIQPYHVTVQLNAAMASMEVDTGNSERSWHRFSLNNWLVADPYIRAQDNCSAFFHLVCPDVICSEILQ